MALDPRLAADFRKVLARYATGVVVVTLRADGDDHAMTANSFTSVSMDPPLVLVCVERDSRFFEALDASDGQWAVSILNADQEGTARWFATKGRPLAGQFERVAHHRAPNGLPLIDGALAHILCHTEARHEAGDHDILVGQVSDMAIAEAHQQPLLYFAHGFRALSTPQDSDLGIGSG